MPSPHTAGSTMTAFYDGQAWTPALARTDAPGWRRDRFAFSIELLVARDDGTAGGTTERLA